MSLQSRLKCPIAKFRPSSWHSVKISCFYQSCTVIQVTKYWSGYGSISTLESFKYMTFEMENSGSSNEICNKTKKNRHVCVSVSLPSVCTALDKQPAHNHTNKSLIDLKTLTVHIAFSLTTASICRTCLNRHLCDKKHLTVIQVVSHSLSELNRKSVYFM